MSVICFVCYSDMKEEIDRYICKCGNTILNSTFMGNMCATPIVLEKGTKHDTEKLRLDLIPTDAVQEVARVYTFGAKKYGDRNWEKGLLYHRPFGATLRHMYAFWDGEQLDKETNIHHLAHAICELEFLLAFELRNMKHLDDRPLQNREGTTNEENKGS